MVNVRSYASQFVIKFVSVPYGNYSYIKVLADEKDLPLYGSGGFRLIWDTKFDAGWFYWIVSHSRTAEF